MKLDPDGAERFRAAFAPEEIAALARLLSGLEASARLGRVPGLAVRLAPADAIARRLIGPAARAAGAKYFDKSAARNWALGWHQDRTIPLLHRREVAGFSQWTVKDGIPHCVPPFALLERTLTLRIHLDDAGPENAPLLIAPGSHRLGPLAEPEIPATVERCGTFACLADAGDAWACSTPILHASARAAKPARRRVLQLLYAAEPLPGGLEWAGV
jgi:hypothetical protein